MANAALAGGGCWRPKRAVVPRRQQVARRFLLTRVLPQEEDRFAFRRELPIQTKKRKKVPADNGTGQQRHGVNTSTTNEAVDAAVIALRAPREWRLETPEPGTSRGPRRIVPRFRGYVVRVRPSEGAATVEGGKKTKSTTTM